MLTIRTIIILVIFLTVEFTAFAQGIFYRRFEGKYGRQTMVVNLAFQAGGLRGNYYIKENPETKEFGGRSTLAGTYAYFEIMGEEVGVGAEAIENLSGVLAGSNFDGSHQDHFNNTNVQFSLRENYKDATKIELVTKRNDVRKRDFGMILYITINYPQLGNKLFDDAVTKYVGNFIAAGNKPVIDYLDEAIKEFQAIADDTENLNPPKKNYRIMTDIKMNDRNIVSVHLQGSIKTDGGAEKIGDFIANFDNNSKSLITTDKILKGDWQKLVNARFVEKYGDESIKYTPVNTIGNQNFFILPEGITFLTLDANNVPTRHAKFKYEELAEYLTGTLPTNSK